MKIDCNSSKSAEIEAGIRLVCGTEICHSPASQIVRTKPIIPSQVCYLCYTLPLPVAQSLNCVTEMCGDGLRTGKATVSEIIPTMITVKIWSLIIDNIARFMINCRRFRLRISQ
jgi:hypothetical protein